MQRLQPHSQRFLLLMLRLYQIVHTEGFWHLLRKLRRASSAQWLMTRQRQSQPTLAVDPPLTTQPQVLLVDQHLPAPDRDSGSLRQFNLMLTLQTLGLQVTCAAANVAAPSASHQLLAAHGIRCLSRPAVRSLAQHLATDGNRYQLVILSRADVASAVLTSVRRHCPQAKIVFDTVDLHFLREGRLAELHPHWSNRWLATLRQRQELALVAAADATLVVSPLEQELVQTHCPHAQVHCVSNIHQIADSATPVAERHDLLFIGGFAHAPNADAVRWLLREIMPLVWTTLPTLHCHIIGADPPADLRALASERVSIHGHVPEVQAFFAHCRLSVAPLRYGAGVKGKINQSLAHGLPVVATPMAAEGMFLIDEESVFIADTAPAFAAAIVRLYTDMNSWERLSRNGIRIMEQHFSVAAAQMALDQLLKQLLPTHF